MLKYYFTDHDEVNIKRGQAEREKKRMKTAHGDDGADFIYMEDIDLQDETEQLGKESLTPPPKEPSKPKSSSSEDDYEEAVESMKRSFDNAAVITWFNDPVDICSIVDEVEGGEFKVINKSIDASGPPDVKALEGMLTRTHNP